MYCHLNVKTGSRSTGQSAAAKYEYISREGRYAEARQDEVVHVESGCMPAFAASDAREYWAAADSHERSNGRLFRSLTAALPNSLDADDRLKLARSFASHVTAGEMPYTLALHAGLSREPGTPDNPHLHLVFSERVNDGVERAADLWFRRAAPAGKAPASGGARKSERTKPREWLEETRKSWAEEMNLAFDLAGVDDRVTAESHAAQLARAREEGDEKEQERLLLNPPSEHIGPAAKHRWEDRSPEQKPDRYAEYEQAEAAAREVRLAHERDVAEVAAARRRIEKLDEKIAALEAQQRRAEAAARRRREAAERRDAQQQREEAAARRRREAGARREADRRDRAKWEEKQKSREAALRLSPGGLELYLAHLADIDPTWNVDGNTVTAPGNVDAALGADESDARRLERLRAVLTDGDAAARYQRQLDTAGARFTTADIDDALAPAERLQERVSRLRELFAKPGGDAAFFAALEDRNPSWPRKATPTDIDRALDVAERSRERRLAARWEHRVIVEAEQQFPGVPSAAWRRTGERFDDFTDTGPAGRRITRKLSDRARALAIAAERAEPPAPPGLVKRLFEWVRERVERLLGRLRPPRAAQRRDRSPVGDVQPSRTAATEREPADATERERRDWLQAHNVINAARAAARKWGDVPLATETAVSVAESIGARPGTPAAHRAVLEQIREAAPRSLDAAESAALRHRCHAEKKAAAGRRHQQALTEWESQPWPLRQITARPIREHAGLPNPHELAAARRELAGVVSSAMIAELDRLMPQRRPATPPADRARGAHGADAARRDHHQVEQPAERQRDLPVRSPDAPPRPAPARTPARRDRGHEPGF